MRRMLIANGLLAIAAAALLLAPWPASAATHSVDAGGTGGNYAFAPEDITISAGDTVEWSFTGEATHNLTADDGSFNSPDEDPGGTYSRTFSTGGVSIRYFCTFHGGQGGIGMSGTITVQAAATNTPPAATNTPSSGSATPTRTHTRTPEATATPGATNTPGAAVTGVPTPPDADVVVLPGAEEVIPISAPADGSGGAGAGGARPALTAPSTGTGDGLRDSDWRRDAAMALAIAGSAMIALAVLTARRRAV